MIISTLSVLTMVGFILAALILLFSGLSAYSLAIKANDNKRRSLSKMTLTFAIILSLVIVLKGVIFAIMV